MNTKSYHYINTFHLDKPISTFEYPYINSSKPEASIELELSGGSKTRITWAGRMTEQKGIMQLISNLRTMNDISLPIEWKTAG